MPWKYSCTGSIITAAVCLIVLLSFTITSLIPKQTFSEFSQGSSAPLLGDQIKVASNAADNGSRLTPLDDLAGTLIIVTVSNNGIFLPGATYSITPNPVSGSGRYVIKDDGPADINKVSAGVITISGSAARQIYSNASKCAKWIFERYTIQDRSIRDKSKFCNCNLYFSRPRQTK